MYLPIGKFCLDRRFYHFRVNCQGVEGSLKFCGQMSGRRFSPKITPGTPDGVGQFLRNGHDFRRKSSTDALCGISHVTLGKSRLPYRIVLNSQRNLSISSLPFLENPSLAIPLRVGYNIASCRFSSNNRPTMKRIFLLGSLSILLLTTLVQAADHTVADRSILDAPILFAKQFNYQGIHIYDTFYQWRPGGGIYVLENPAEEPEKHRVRAVIDPTTPETLGEGIYFDPSLSWDATKILFCFKGSQGGNSTIYEIGVDGKGLRQVTDLDNNGNPYKGSGGGHHDVKPSYLSDERIVFCSTRYSGLVPCANNGVTILHVVNADGSDVHTISVNNVTEFDPNQLSDGRILFGRWEYIDKNALTIQSLWSVMPDGTNETAVYANNMVFPEAVLQAKPVPGAPHLIVATYAPHNAPPRGTIAMIDTRLGKNDPHATFNFEHPDKPTYDRGDSCNPWALSENVVLYSGIPDEADAPELPADITKAQQRNTPKLNALMMIDRTGKKVVVHSDPTIDLHNPIPLLPREKPRIPSDTTDRSKITGNFFVYDVYEGMPHVPRGALKWLRIVEETSRVSESPGGNPLNQVFSISAALAWSPKIYHGIIPIEEDGSVYFEAPAGRSLNFQLLDEDYRLVRSMRTFIQAAPGTTRSCTGCHEYKYGTSPTVAQMRRLAEEPTKPVDESWGSGYLDYPSMVQPILDKKCVSCHGGEKGFAKGLDLSGGWTELFNISYENLTARREKQYIADLISGICCMNGTAYWSCKIFEPYEHGSGNAPLADILLSEPHKTDAGLTQAERELIFTWIDSNGLYFGTWDYTQTGAYAREYVPAKNSLIVEMKQSRCAECHLNDKGEVKRFDDWINLQNPAWSRILRAPLAKAAGGESLCRDRKFNQVFSRRGLMFQYGYAHGVLDLDKFPTQQWEPWEKSLEGEPVDSFMSTDDPTYRKMLEIIEDARSRQLLNPRVDMPYANEIGKGVTAGRYRQIIPQPLPDPLPNIEATVDDDGVVRLCWERSSRTIGLITEIHRLTSAGDALTAENRIGRTERFEFTDKDAPMGTNHYAVVFVTDPAETCGTCKSGAVLNYTHPMLLPMSTASISIPQQKRIEDRCPLAMIEPMKSEPARFSVVAPELKAPPMPNNLRAIGLPGLVRLRWDEARPGQYRYNIYAGGRKLTAEPIAANSFDIVSCVLEEAEYTVETVSKLVGGKNSVKGKPLPEHKEPVFVLAADKGKLVAPATFDGDELDVSKGGHFVVEPNDEFNLRGTLSIEISVKFDEPGQMPVVMGYGLWNDSGWFLQKIGGRWRFHVGGVDCDGGEPKIGEWLHVIGTYDGETLRLYENGKLVAEKYAAVTRIPWTKNLIIGQYSGSITPAFQVKGRIKDVRIWQRVLKPEEIMGE